MKLIRKNISYYFSSKKKLAKAIKNISGYKPINLKVYELALTHSSTNKASRLGSKFNNERLEYLGDAVLDTVIAEILFKKFPRENEGFLTEMRSRIVNTHSLNEMSRKLGLDKLLIYDIKNRNLTNKTKGLYADALEAFIGAIYIDLGYQKAFTFINKRLVKLYVDFEELQNTAHNYKSLIYEWGQKFNREVDFELIKTIESGPRKQFIMRLKIDGEGQTEGRDFSKKAAEQIAAEKYYEALDENDL